MPCRGDLPLKRRKTIENELHQKRVCRGSLGKPYLCTGKVWYTSKEKILKKKGHSALSRILVEGQAYQGESKDQHTAGRGFNPRLSKSNKRERDSKEWDSTKSRPVEWGGVSDRLHLQTCKKIRQAGKGKSKWKRKSKKGTSVAARLIV